MNSKQAKRGFMAFFHTELGRKTVFVVSGATTLGLFLSNFLPQTFGLKFYKDFVQSYEDGIAKPVPAAVQRRLEKAMEILEVSPFEQKIIKPFTVFGFDLFQAGSTKYRFGAMLGIPVNFSYTTTDDIDRSAIFVRDQPINWSSERAKLLQESLVLDENEQLFGMCKSILQVQTHSVLLNSIFPSVSFLSVYTMGHYLNNKLQLLARPFSLRLVMYMILGLFGLGSWSFMKDFNQVAYDTDIDKKLSTLGPEFIDAGTRYYDKLLKKNMALRELIGDDMYTAKGNVNYFLRQKSLPLTLRKSFFEEKWRQLQEDTQSKSEAQ